jgi:hypothetical protein
MGKVTHEVAEKEVLKWLDFKKVDDEREMNRNHQLKQFKMLLLQEF